MSAIIAKLTFAACLACGAAYSVYNAVSPVFATIANAAQIHMAEDKAGRPVNQR